MPVISEELSPEDKIVDVCLFAFFYLHQLKKHKLPAKYPLDYAGGLLKKLVANHSFPVTKDLVYLHPELWDRLPHNSMCCCGNLVSEETCVLVPRCRQCKGIHSAEQTAIAMFSMELQRLSNHAVLYTVGNFAMSVALQWFQDWEKQNAHKVNSSVDVDDGFIDLSYLA